MLSKAPLNVSESIKFGGNNFRRSPPIVEHGHGCHFRGISELQWRRSRGLSARASSETGYTRKPLETAGAYELIDEETGEKVIVWGGAEDDPVIPSKGVLSWKPQSRRDKNYKSSSGSSSNGVESASSVESDDLSARRKDLPGSFAKLKAQKIRALSRKGSHVKKDGAGNEDIRQGDQSFRGLDALDSELQFTLKNKNRDYPRNKGSISITSKSHHVQGRTGSFESTPS